MIKFVFDIQRFNTYTVSGSNTFLKGTSGNDTFSNTSYSYDYVTISGGAGNDSVYNSYGYNFSISGGTGKDTITNGGRASTATGGAGNDYISNSGWYAVANGGAGNDIIENSGDYVTINGGDGNDKISITTSYAYSNVISGGKGNDTIFGTNRTSYGYNYRYANGDGYDKIYNFGSDDTITFTSGRYTKSTIGSDIVFYSYENTTSKSPNGAITLVGAAGKDIAIEGFRKNETVKKGTITNRISFSTVQGTDGKDIVNNSGSNVLVLTNGGNDSVYNSGYHVTIGTGAGDDTINNYYVNYISMSGGEGNDYISNTSAWYSTVEAGNGDDTIVVPVKAWQDIIDGGAGNDKISLGSYSGTYNGANTVTGGAGNDTIYGDSNATVGNVYVYNSDGGYDHIYDYNSIDMLKLGEGLSNYSTTSSGSNVIVSVNGGSITLHNAANKTVNIFAYTNNTVSSSTVNGSSRKDIITNTGYSSKIFGYAENDSIYNSGSRTTIDAGAGNDTITNDYSSYVSINGGAGNDSIESAGSYATVNGGAGNDRISLTSAYSSDNVVIGGKGNDTIFNPDRTYASTYSRNYRYANGDGYDVIYNVISADTITFTSGYYTKKTSGSDVILYSYSSATSSAANGKITLMGAADKTFTIKGKKKPKVVEEDGVIVNGRKVTLTENYEKESFSFTGKFESATTLDASAAMLALNITGNKFANSIIGSTQNDTISGDKGNDILNGAAGDDTIIGGVDSDTLSGGEGADVFVYNAGDGNDKITDYTSEDRISIKGDTVSDINYSGNDVVFTLEKYNNNITIVGGANKIITYVINDSGNNDTENTYMADVSKYVDFTNQGASVNLKATYPTSSFSPSNYTKYQTTLVTINSSAVQHDMAISGTDNKNYIIGGTQDDTIDGGKGADTIKGGDGNDKIYGGKGNDELHGGVGNDTLWGGEDNDQLYGDEGEDIFYYNIGDGNDTIFNYESGIDKIILGSGTVENVAFNKNGNVIFQVSNGDATSGQIIVNDAVSISVEIIDPKGKVLKYYNPSS